MQLKEISFPKNHIQSPFSHQMPDGQILSITEKKTQIIALSVLVGIFTLGIGGVLLFYSLAAKYKVEQIEKFESEAARRTNLSSISAGSLSHICAYLSTSDLNSLARVDKQTGAIANNKLIMREANDLGWNRGRDEANRNIQSAKNYLSELFIAVLPRFYQYRDSSQIREAHNLTDGIWVYNENYHKMLQIAHNLKSLTKIKLRNLSIDVMDQGDTDIVKLLVHLPDKNSKTLLNWLAEKNHYEKLELFIDGGVDINMASRRGDTPLHSATRKGHYNTVKLLIDKRADINVAQQQGETALHYAAHFGRYKIAKLLIDKGAAVNAAKQGDTPLLHAVYKGHEKIAKLLIDKGAAVNAAYQGETPLLHAVYKGHDKTVKLLIDKGADVNAADQKSLTPLHYAIHFGRYEIAELLIDKGADVNAAGQKSLTPLHYALYRGHYKIAVLLVEKGADVKLVDDRGRIPFDNVIKKFLYYCYSWKMMQRLS